MADADLTAARLREVLHYDPLTGVFTWRVSPTNSVRIGSVAGCMLRKGYISIRIDGKMYLAQRLAVLYMTGAFPAGECDHRNGARADNKWANLRDVSKSLNQQNQRHPRGANQFLGVSLYKRTGLWYACIRINGKSKNLGLHGTPELARAAYLDAKRSAHPGCTI